LLAAFTCSHFRNLTQLEWTPGEGVHLILGKNGAGKSSLLEAIYLLATTRSFRTAKLADCVQHEQQTFYLRGEIESERRVNLEASWTDGRRSRQVNGERVGLMEHLSVLPVVAWSSAEEEVISGSPAHRRRFVDRGIVGSRPAALGVLRNFRRAIEQKRHLLAARGAGIEAWNEVLAAAILELGSLRQKWVEKLAGAIQEVVTTAAFSVPKIEVFFRPSVSGAGDGLTEILDQLNRWSDRERQRRRPLVGSHLDDLEILWGGREARRVASAGERKLIGLILTAARAHLLNAEGRAPICLLDDADSDLDQERLEAARSLFVGCKQVMISSSRAEPWKAWEKARFWRLTEGFLAPMDRSIKEPRNSL
jgi:DNA replication and repair protein RecF